MQCTYCQTWNEHDERRCVRCGRRLHLASARPAPETYPLSSSTGNSATALALESIPGGQPLSEAPPERTEYQPSLFRDAGYGEHVPGPKVIPIPMLTPTRPVAAPVQRRSRPASPRPPRRVPQSQQSLDFHGVPADSALGTEVHAVIYCDAPVALPAHRMIAAAFDMSMVLIAMGLFLGVFFLSGGIMTLSKQNAPFLILVAVLMTLFYRFLWVLGNGETPGMRFAGLRLVNFDGRCPDRDQRAFRQVSSILSILSAGLGLVWALVDEESLTWHDHISKTFPTPG
ncbi:MAG TPA: RDD family protein [Bryobacteraceae bacterium]|nr:RDD family protein [Bryobacteraceae bacterium]